MNTLESLLTVAESTESIALNLYVLSIFAAMLLGVCFSYALQFKNYVSKSFAVTIALLPPVVCVVIMMVSGSIGAGIAVAGSFSLVRFRSLPGTAREIVAVFISMAIGLSCAMGNILYAIIFTAIMVLGMLVLENTGFGVNKDKEKHKILRITISEDLDYTEIFDDLLAQYTASYKLTAVRTTNLGSMFKLSYNILLNDKYEEKELIDEIRVRNGNLEVSCSMMSTASNEL